MAGVLDDSAARELAQVVFETILAGEDNEVSRQAVGLTDKNDLLLLGRHLAPLMTDAAHRWLSGERSESLGRAVSAMLASERVSAQSVTAATTSPNLRALIRSSVPSVAQRMIVDSGIYGIPLPDESDRAGDLSVASVRCRAGGSLEQVTAFYKDYMSTDGWIFDADASEVDPGVNEERNVGYCSWCCYSQPSRPVRTVNISVWQEGPKGSADLRIQIQDLPGEDLPEYD